MQQKVIRFIAAGFGSGFIPFAPGTFGTLLGIPLGLALSTLSRPLSLALALLILFSGVWICGRAARDAGQEDPGWIVLDEIIGFSLASLWLAPSLKTYAAAFFFFRLFDILKPPPVGWIDRSGAGGWAIVFDDAAAGLMARLSVAALEWRTPL